MITSDLKKKWELISENKIINGFKSLRISSECIAEIFLGIDNKGNHCLILSLPDSYKIDFNSIIKEKISINLYRNPCYIVLALQDHDYSDLFDDLILSLYNAIKDIFDIDIYSKVFIQTFYKWNEFFEDKKTDRLSPNIIKGLFGELLILIALAKEADSSNINEILNSWKGPYEQGHDFILDKKNIEVKTKDVTRKDIRISSEFQLEKEFGKKLELLVISIEFDPENGVSIKDLVSDIKYIVINKLGDCSILLKAIKQKGLTFKNISEYDNLRFNPVSHAIYDCCNNDFPKLIESNLPKELNGIKYNIQLSTLDRFILFEKRY